MDLTISLEGNSSKPMYEQIYDYIKNEIQNGGLPFGERLPSTRKLSQYLQVSRSTVDLAYQQLISEGYIESIPCKGYYISQLEGIHWFRKDRQTQLEEEEQGRPSCLYDFSPSGIDVDSFPYNTWRKVSKNIVGEEQKELFRLGDPKGDYSLRKTIADYLHQSRGVDCLPSQIIVGAGNDYLLLLLGAVFGRNHHVAMENPTYKKAFRIMEGQAAKVSAIPMDHRGINVEMLEESGADMVYVMPSHQFPLGTVMPVKRRMELLEWACRRENRYIIEDDYDSEFRYKGKPIPALQGYDKEGRVIYLGTFSRSLAPAIRVSYMVLPQALLGEYEKRGKIFSSTVSRVDQQMIHQFIREGYFERHLNHMRATYKSRHDVLLEQLRPLLSIARISGENAGVHVLLHFQGNTSEEELIERAEKLGVRVYGVSRYAIGNGTCNLSPTIVLGYANLSEEEIINAAGLLKKAWL